MTLNLERLKRLQKISEQQKRDRAKIEGRIESLLEELREQGYQSVEDGQKALEDMNKKIKSRTKIFHRKLHEFEKKYHSIISKED